MPNRKTDTNNNFAISTDHIGANYEYPDGDYATRDRIYRDHVEYQQGLMYTLANNSRVRRRSASSSNGWDWRRTSSSKPTTGRIRCMCARPVA